MPRTARRSARSPLLEVAPVVPAPASWVTELDAALTDQLALAVRGPKREGLLAVWLVTRAAADCAEQFAVEPSQWQARHDALAARLSSLAIAAPLRRALTAAMAMLAVPEAAHGPLVLSLLAAPVRDVLGDLPAAALARAALASRSTA